MLVEEHRQEDKRNLGEILLEQLGLRVPGVRLKVGVALEEEKNKLNQVVLKRVKVKKEFKS